MPKTPAAADLLPATPISFTGIQTPGPTSSPPVGPAQSQTLPVEPPLQPFENLPTGFQPGPYPSSTPAPVPHLPPGFQAPPAYGELSPQSILPLSPGDPNPALMGPRIDQFGGSQVPAPKQEARRRLRWPGIVFPLLFLILAAIMVYLVLDLSELLPSSRARNEALPAPTEQPAAPASPNAAARLRATEPSPPSARPSSPTVNVGFNSPNSARLPVEQPMPAPQVPPQPPAAPQPLLDERDINVEGQVPVAPLINLDRPAESRGDPPPSGNASPDSILMKFLAARSLEERRPFLSKSSSRSDTVLAGSALAKPLPEVVLRRPVRYVKDNSDDHAEHFFEVSFQKSPDELPSPILVQLNEWGDGQIRVHTDAFLDLYNDELATFGRAPAVGERTFHAVADAYKSCFEENIPDHGNKAFVKLRSHPRISPRLKAYFNRDGVLAEQISKSEGLRWGSSDVCTVTVKWNTDSPTQPYVELVRIDGFGTWNP